MEVADVDDLAYRKEQASFALEAIEAKHVAGGGSTDISREVGIVRDYHDAVHSVVNAATQSRDKAAKEANDSAAQAKDENKDENKDKKS